MYVQSLAQQIFDLVCLGVCRCCCKYRHACGIAAVMDGLYSRILLLILPPNPHELDPNTFLLRITASLRDQSLVLKGQLLFWRLVVGMYYGSMGWLILCGFFFSKIKLYLLGRGNDVTALVVVVLGMALAVCPGLKQTSSSLHWPSDPSRVHYMCWCYPM